MIEFEHIQKLFITNDIAQVALLEQIIEKHIPQNITFKIDDLHRNTIKLDCDWIINMVVELAGELYDYKRISNFHLIESYRNRMYKLHSVIVSIISSNINISNIIGKTINTYNINAINDLIVNYNNIQATNNNPTLNDVILHYVGIKQCFSLLPCEEALTNVVG